MVATGTGDASCRDTTPKSWSVFGSQKVLSICRQARMTVQFHYNGAPSAFLAVWMYLVPDETMRCLILLGRDSWMRLHSRSYQTLPPTPNGRVLGELTLAHICDNNVGGVSAYIRNCDAPEVAYRLIYEGKGMSLDTTRFPCPHRPLHGP